MHLGENYKENNLNLPEKNWEKGEKFGKRNKNKNKEKPGKSGEMEI